MNNKENSAETCGSPFPRLSEENIVATCSSHVRISDEVRPTKKIKKHFKKKAFAIIRLSATEMYLRKQAAAGKTLYLPANQKKRKKTPVAGHRY